MATGTTESPKLNSTDADRKMRFGGILENPVISNVQRAILDGGRVRGLKKALQALDYKTIVDVGCGLGEGSAVNKGLYIGVDNSYPRIAYAAKQHPRCKFLVADAMNLPVADKSADMAMLIDTSHHLTDAQFLAALLELKRISRRYLVVSDPVLYEGQGALSKLLYKLDRGACFRSEQQSQAIFSSTPGVRFIETFSCRTFPGFYIHQGFVLEITGN